jgi:ABC-type nitrate/sulfonate/bicarbonate transport system ATPase subunit
MQTINEPIAPNTVTSDRQPFLEITGVSKVYPTADGSYTVLEDVELTVYEKEFICLIGHSGCGKSTLLNMVAGFSGANCWHCMCATTANHQARSRSNDGVSELFVAALENCL